MPTTRRADVDLPLLDLRELNRALLARQLLGQRAKLSIPSAIERLGALQAQWPPAPYVALWSRLDRFTAEDLERALRERMVVKATLMRGTLHLVSARDYPAYAVATPEARRSLWPSTQRQYLRYLARELPEAARLAEDGRLPIADGEALHAELLRFAARPRSREEIVELIARRGEVSHELAEHLVWGFVGAYGLLVHEPESAMRDARARGRLVAARVALPGLEIPAVPAAARRTVERHLAAFGPATVDDVCSWSSLRATLVREALASLGARVSVFRDEAGRTLYDLARSPRPAGDTPAPPRLLPKWDSALLAYAPAERVRILPERYRKAVILKNGDVAQTFLIDGMVAGTWAVTRRGREATIELRPFRPLPRSARPALLEEAERLADFLAPEAAGRAARVVA